MGKNPQRGIMELGLANRTVSIFNRFVQADRYSYFNCGSAALGERKMHLIPASVTASLWGTGGLNSLLRGLFVLLVSLVFTASLQADGEGQADLDEATRVKVRAQEMDDLEKVVELCESAIKKGLDKDSETYAKELLTSTLYERAARMSQVILDRQPPDQRWRVLRRLALTDLEKALTYNDQLGQVHLLIARLQALPSGDIEKAKQAVGKAIELLTDDPRQLAAAYVVKGSISEDSKEQEASFQKAIDLNPQNADAWRARAIWNLNQNAIDKAMEDFTKLLEVEPDDIIAHQALARILGQQERFDEAIAHLDKLIEAGSRSPVTYELKAEILAEKGDKRAAIDCLNEALKINARDIRVLLALARLRIDVGDYDLAQNDLKLVLELNPEMPQAFLLRSMLAAQQKRYEDAIRDIKHLLESTPDNADLKSHLATLYIQDERPSKAIALLTEVIEGDPENWQAYRIRGDALLSLGKHGEAISDYEAALHIKPDDDGVLNNLAWVLATSPDDKLRDANRSLELATKACELTKYQKAHILSTLAASYAELGKFDEAIKWSEKAVELDKDEKQLANELKSYKDGKPWRELQQVQEKPEPEPPNESDLQIDIEADDETGDDTLRDN
jgi:tetratricopeptide (TPR) repeat protein